MTHMTEQQLLTQEKHDQNVHHSTRVMYEHLLRRTVERAISGEDVKADIAMLVETFNHTSEDCQRLVGLLRRARQGEI